MTIALDNVVAVVTGAAGGIGRAIVQAMRAAGATVVATDRSDTFWCFAVALPGRSGSLLVDWSTGRSVMIVTDTYFRI